MNNENKDKRDESMTDIARNVAVKQPRKGFNAEVWMCITQVISQ